MKPSMRTHAHSRFASCGLLRVSNGHLLVGLGTAVLPDIPLYDPDSHYAPYIAHVLLRHLDKIYYVLIVGRINIVYIVGTFLGLPLTLLVVILTHFRASLLLLCSRGHIPDSMCEHLLAVMDPSAPYWSVSFPFACPIVPGVEFQVCIRNDVHM